MREVQNTGKIILFVFLLLALLSVAGRVLSRPHAIEWGTEAGLELVHRFRDQYDICFAGTSIIMANISNQELFEKYGIRAVSAGEPEQPLFLTKYTIREVFRYQHPRAIILDTRNIFYSEERVRVSIQNNEDYFLHNSLDSIYSPVIKKEALDQVNRQYKEIDEKEYFFRIYNRHAQWKNLRIENFRDCSEENCINGNLMMTDLYNVADVTSQEQIISEENEGEVFQIKEECEKNGADLILMTAYIDTDTGNREEMRRLAQKIQVDYIDINDVLDEIGFEGNLQHDFVHFNIIGATVWTDWLGQYLCERYSFGKPSKKLERLYQEQSELCSAYKNCVSNKILFGKNCHFKSFLKEMIESGLSNTAVFAAVSEDAYTALDEEGKELLRQIGLDGPQCTGGSYAGACVAGEVSQESDDNEKVTVSGQIDTWSYTVESAGANSEDGPGTSILVNGGEYAKGQRGLNIVLFDERLGELIATKCFDTGVETDPEES